MKKIWFSDFAIKYKQNIDINYLKTKKLAKISGYIMNLQKVYIALSLENTFEKKKTYTKATHTKHKNGN